MSEDVARAIGSNSATTLTINDKTVSLSPLELRDWTEAQQICLKEYRQEYMKAFLENLEFFPRKEKMEFLREETRRTAAWKIEDLPNKEAFNPAKIVVNQAIEEWYREAWDIAEEDDLPSVKTIQEAVAASLENESKDTLTPEIYEKMTGKKIKPVKVDYVSWWLGATPSGQMVTIWLAVRKEGITREDVEKHLNGELAERQRIILSQEVERISKPDLGNG